MGRRSGLGKGLGALIPANGAKEDDTPLTGLAEIPVTAIRPNPLQPRHHFDEEALSELADSIRAVGLLQPVLVREADNGYELIAGERRWRAARRAGLQQIPALIRTAGDANSLSQAVIENVHRANLNPLEEAAALQQLIEDFGLTHDDIANRVGKSRPAVTNLLRLLALPPSVQKLLREQKLTMGHTRALLGTPNRGMQEDLARQAAAEGWSVRAVEEAVRKNAPQESRPKVPTGSRLRPPGLLELEQLLGDYLNTRVRVDMGGKHGKVMVEFSTLEDLERVYKLMTAGVPEPVA